MVKKIGVHTVALSVVVLLAIMWTVPVPAHGGSGRGSMDHVQPLFPSGYPDCASASYQVGTLPFAESSTTSGAGDEYNLGAAGTCAGGGAQFPSTGLGDDVVYLIATDLNCTLGVSMDPTGVEDLALYVLSPDCDDVAGHCVIVDDAGGGGVQEDVEFSVAAGQPYYVIVDGYNGGSGPYDLTIFETSATGCQLVNPQAGYDLGDAPDSSNHVGRAMTAYASGGGPPNIAASYPSVFDPATGLPPGPRHQNPGTSMWLGPSVTEETDADLLPDEDGVKNIDPTPDRPDQDGADDGVQLPAELSDCSLQLITYTVTVAPGVPTLPRYVNVWLDYNRDGDWQDVLDCEGLEASEWAVQDHVIAIGPGTHVLTTPWILPYNPSPVEPMWMRITLSEQPAPTDPTVASGADGRGPSGGYQLGETEDYYLWAKWAVYLPLVVRH